MEISSDVAINIPYLGVKTPPSFVVIPYKYFFRFPILKELLPLHTEEMMMLEFLEQLREGNSLAVVGYPSISPLCGI